MSTSIASSSRWLVGSSSSRQVGRVVMIVASASRVRWPPDSVPTPPVGIEAVEAEPGGGDRRPPVRVPRVVRERVLQRPLVRRVARRGAHRGGQPLDVGDRGAQRRERHGEDLGDRGAVAERRLLAEQHEVVGRLDGAGGPARAGSRPATARSSVDLPTPFSPTRPIRRPGWASRSMPVRTVRSG